MRNLFVLRTSLQIFLCSLLASALISHHAFAQALSIDSFEAKINRETNPQIVDTRSSEEFEINHIPGAVNIDILKPGYRKQVKKLNKTKPVFLYAIGTARSRQLETTLSQKGFAEIYLLDGGIGGWIGNGKKIYNISKENFSQNEFDNIILSNKLVLVDLHIRFCPVCKKLQPVVDTLSHEFGDALKVVRIDVYCNPKIAGNFKIDAVPTIIAFQDGRVIYRKTGPDIDKTEIEGVLTNQVISR